MEKPLSEPIDAETAEEFRARVERTYNYTIGPDESWCLHGNLLIVAHPERQPILVHLGGRIERLEPHVHA